VRLGYFFCILMAVFIYILFHVIYAGAFFSDTDSKTQPKGNAAPQPKGDIELEPKGVNLQTKDTVLQLVVDEALDEKTQSSEGLEDTNNPEIKVKKTDKQAALDAAFPPGKLSTEHSLRRSRVRRQERLNIYGLLRKFLESEYVELKSWERFSSEFEKALEYFVTKLPAPASKTISQLLAALGINKKYENEYLIGLGRPDGTPVMPVAVWTREAELTLPDKNNDSGRKDLLKKWLERLPGITEEDLDLIFRSKKDNSSEPSASDRASATGDAKEDPEEVRLVIAAGGGSDVVTAACLCAHKQAPCVVVQPGRFHDKDGNHVNAIFKVEDYAAALKPEEFYEGTKLVGRTHFLSLDPKMGFPKLDFLFMAQNKKVLSTDPTKDVVELLVLWREGIVEELKDKKVTHVDIIDAGGDIILITENTRGERDVWNLILGLMVARELNCDMSLVLVSPGVDGQSVWLNDSPKVKVSLKDLKEDE